MHSNHAPSQREQLEWHFGVAQPMSTSREGALSWLHGAGDPPRTFIGDLVKRIIVIALTTVFSVSAVIAADPIKVTPPQQKTLAGSGRYVFGQISEFRADQYMLDTQTGRLWRIVLRRPKNQDGTDAPGDSLPVLDAVPYVAADGNLSAAPK
jgi:hypothetical protein